MVSLLQTTNIFFLQFTYVFGQIELSAKLLHGDYFLWSKKETSINQNISGGRGRKQTKDSVIFQVGTILF
jgi:hypothetical protein